MKNQKPSAEMVSDYALKPETKAMLKAISILENRAESLILDAAVMRYVSMMPAKFREAVKADDLLPPLPKEPAVPKRWPHLATAGSKGGKKAAANMTPEERKLRARKAVAARLNRDR